MSMGSLATDILQNIFFCVQQKKEIHFKQQTNLIIIIIIIHVSGKERFLKDHVTLKTGYS